jgi:hypothetical protein
MYESSQFKTCRILSRYIWYRSYQFLEIVHIYSITRELFSFEIYLSYLKRCPVSRNSLENTKTIALYWGHVPVCLYVCMLSDCDLVLACNSHTDMFKIWHWNLSLKAVSHFWFSVILIYNKAHFILGYKCTLPCMTNVHTVKQILLKFCMGD